MRGSRLVILSTLAATGAGLSIWGWRMRQEHGSGEESASSVAIRHPNSSPGSKANTSKGVPIPIFRPSSEKPPGEAQARPQALLTSALVLERLAEALKSSEGKDAQARKDACKAALGALEQLPGAQEAFLTAFLDESAAVELREALTVAWDLEDLSLTDSLLSKIPSLSTIGQELGIRLARGPWSEERRRLWTRHPELLDPLLSLTSHPDQEVSICALEGLAFLAQTQIKAWSCLEGAALDASTTIESQEAALHLLALVDPARVAPVVSRLLQDPSSAQRDIAVCLLYSSSNVGLGGPETPQALYEAALPTLQRILTDPAEDVSRKTHAIWALQGRRSEWMKGELVRISEDVSQPLDLRDAAVSGLGLYQDDPFILERIKALALRDTSNSATDVPPSIQALRKQPPSQDPSYLFRKESLLLGLLRESNSDPIRLGAIEILGDCAGGAALGPLEEIQRSASSERERRTAGISMTKIQKRLSGIKP